MVLTAGLLRTTMHLLPLYGAGCNRLFDDIPYYCHTIHCEPSLRRFRIFSSSLILSQHLLIQVSVALLSSNYISDNHFSHIGT